MRVMNEQATNNTHTYSTHSAEVEDLHKHKASTKRHDHKERERGKVRIIHVINLTITYFNLFYQNTVWTIFMKTRCTSKVDLLRYKKGSTTKLPLNLLIYELLSF